MTWSKKSTNWEWRFFLGLSRMNWAAFAGTTLEMFKMNWSNFFNWKLTDFLRIIQTLSVLSLTARIVCPPTLLTLRRTMVGFFHPFWPLSRGSFKGSLISDFFSFWPFPQKISAKSLPLTFSYYVETLRKLMFFLWKRSKWKTF